MKLKPLSPLLLHRVQRPEGPLRHPAAQTPHSTPAVPFGQAFANSRPSVPFCVPTAASACSGQADDTGHLNALRASVTGA